MTHQLLSKFEQYEERILELEARIQALENQKSADRSEVYKATKQLVHNTLGVEKETIRVWFELVIRDYLVKNLEELIPKVNRANLEKMLVNYLSRNSADRYVTEKEFLNFVREEFKQLAQQVVRERLQVQVQLKDPE